MRAWPAVVVVALLVLAPAEAAARCDKRASRRLLSEGKKFFDLGRYDDAIERWERAYIECDDPLHIFNLAQAHRKAGHVEQAIEFYRRWLQLSPDAPADERADVEQRIGELEQRLPAPEAPAAEPPSEAQPPAEDAPAAPPTGPPIATELLPAPPPVADPALRAVPPPPRAPPGSIDRRMEPWYADRWGWVLAGTGVALTGIGVGLVDRGGGGGGGLEYQADGLTLGGAVTTAVGLSVLGSGIVKLVLTESRPAMRPRSQIACGPGWCGVRGVF